MFVLVSLLSFPAFAQGKAIYADGVLMPTLQEAFDAVQPGGTVRIEPGVYKEGATLKEGHDGVLIIGAPGVIFDGIAVAGKAAFVIQSNDVTIESIACRNIRVTSRNGACVRMENGNLTLRDVNFSDSENGILTTNQVNKLLIEDSLFENNGKAGRAHGIYVTGGKQLIIRRTRVLNSKDQGHGIKSRTAITLIENSVVASLEGNDSYLIDIPDGGQAIIRNSLLVEGANTENWHLLTFGPESRKYPENSFTLEKNVIITDREGGSTLFNMGDGMPTPITRGNVVVGRITYDWSGNNIFFDSRGDLNWPDAPALPEIDLTSK
jgi:hypothetical protein